MWILNQLLEFENITTPQIVDKQNYISNLSISIAICHTKLFFLRSNSSSRTVKIILQEISALSLRTRYRRPLKWEIIKWYVASRRWITQNMCIWINSELTTRYNNNEVEREKAKLKVDEKREKKIITSIRHYIWTQQQFIHMCLYLNDGLFSSLIPLDTSIIVHLKWNKCMAKNKQRDAIVVVSIMAIWSWLDCCATE